MNDKLLAAACIVLACVIEKADPNKPFKPEMAFNDGEFERAVETVRLYVGLAGPR